MTTRHRYRVRYIETSCREFWINATSEEEIRALWDSGDIEGYIDRSIEYDGGRDAGADLEITEAGVA